MNADQEARFWKRVVVVVLPELLTAFLMSYMECALPEDWSRDDEAMALAEFDALPYVVAARAALKQAGIEP